MPWLSKEQIAEARRVDLLTYLQEREPHELVRSAPGEYRTVSHGSLVMSNGAWFWNRGQFGGVSALDYLTKVQGIGLVAAVEMIDGIRAPIISSSLPVREHRQRREGKPLVLPPQSKYPTHLLSYLHDRGIHADVIKKCLERGSLYEGRYNGETVCVFVGHDDAGTARFGCVRGVNSDMKRDCSGSDKRFSFHLAANAAANGSLAVFEAPIDALSHATLFPEWRGHRLSLGGTSDVALMAFLERHPHIDNISLCLDADDAGRTASHKIVAAHAGDVRFSHITVTIDPPMLGKDYNEALLHAIRTKREQTQAGPRKETGLSL
ncbi:MAG: DUF3991 and toprim domain-containing protein [Christensenellaceae bacterium]|jgi:hypothetical protein|nr:DUF3991 and toprim domain-containing protein [Christensenellaceae bacterium]